MAQGVSNPTDPPAGVVVDRQYRLLEPLGSGAMARVYRARQLGVERDVAVKVLRAELMNQPDIIERFRREAEIAAELDHPHVVIVHGVGEFPFAPGAPATPYVALELLRGPSLRKLLELTGPLALGRALHIVLGLADAVGEAHAHGIVHRDLKPENVILVQRGNDPDFPKLLDFGLAKQLTTAVGRSARGPASAPEPDFHTREGSVLGTPRYVSPEGAEGRAVTKASDCYALATLLYECLSGRTPFDAPSAVSVLAMQASAPPPHLRLEVGASVPPALADFIMQNLDKRPERRAADGRAFGLALVEAARRDHVDEREFGWSPTLLGTRGGAPAVTLPASTAFGSAQEPALAEATEVTRSSRSAAARLWIFAIACFVIGALVAVGFASSFGRGAVSR